MARDGMNGSQEKKIGKKTRSAVRQKRKGDADDRKESDSRSGIHEKIDGKNDRSAKANEFFEIVPGCEPGFEDPDDQKNKCPKNEYSAHDSPFLNDRGKNKIIRRFA